MPLDYDKAQDGPTAATGSGGGGAVDRAAVVSAVERYLASRGIAAQAAPSMSSLTAPFTAPLATQAAAPSCGCSTPGAPRPAVRESVVASVAAEVVDRFLARRGTAPAGSPGGSPKLDGYS